MKIIRPEKPKDVHLNMLFYSVTGAGKTRLLGTANKCEATKPILIIDIDGGMITLAGKKVDIVRPTNFAEIQEIYEFLRHDNTKYQSVGVDSITELQGKLSMGEIMGDLDEEAEYKEIGKAVPPTRQDWLRSAEQIRRFLRAFKDLAVLKQKSRRLHVFITALEKTDETANLTCPQLPGVLALGCGAFMDVLARLTVRERERDDRVRDYRYLQTVAKADDEGVRVLAKNRGGRLGNGIWRPTIDKLVSAWVSERGGE